MAPAVIFAQLSRNLDAIKLEDSHKVNLYSTEPTELELLISTEYFESMFYNESGLFTLAGDLSDNLQPLEEVWRLMGPTAGGLPFDLANTVLNKWEEDLNIPSDCWSTCSVLDIRRELIILNSTATFACNTKCAYKYHELIQVLDQAYERAPTTSVQPGDVVILSILIHNYNIETKPIELLLHYKISPDTPPYNL